LQKDRKGTERKISMDRYGDWQEDMTDRDWRETSRKTGQAYRGGVADTFRGTARG